MCLANITPLNQGNALLDKISHKSDRKRGLELSREAHLVPQHSYPPPNRGPKMFILGKGYSE